MTDLEAIAALALTFDPTAGDVDGSTIPSAEELAGGHVPQLGYMTDLARFIAAMCSRRAGKTEGVDRRFLRNSLLRPRGNRFYMALTKDQARWMNWEPIWLPLCERWAPDAHHDDTRQITTFPNGSRVRFTGSDDIRHIKTELGAALDEVCVDECQDQPGEVLEELVEKTLPPALADRQGALILAGVVPDVAAGYFWRAWESGGFSRHNWNMFDNPFIGPALAQQAVDACLKLHPGWTADHPLVQRDYYGRFRFETTLTAFRFDPQRHTYTPDTVETIDIGPFKCTFASVLGLDRFVVGIDPAQRQDRFAFVVWGWNHLRKQLYQVAEAVTLPGADPFESEWLAVCAALKERYRGTMEFIRDPGSSSATNDTLWNSHGIMVESAVKGPGSVKARVDRLADLMERGSAKVLAGGELSDDMMTCRWDKEARANGKWELDKSQKSPDVCDAATYGLGLPLFSEIGAVAVIPAARTRSEIADAEAAKQAKYVLDILAGKVRRPTRAPLSHLWKKPA